MAKVVLILGGTKTGKTGFAQASAQKLQSDTGKGVGYIATALILDSEMEDRVRRHREDRPLGWTTVEEPLNLTGALEKATQGACAVILDCLTLYMTNVLMNLGDEPDRDEASGLIRRELESFFLAARDWEGTIYILSNLVENGLISVHAFARIFQDVAGMTHQYAARQADEVYQMIAGIPDRIK